MDTSENKNFFKLAFILLETVTEQLRSVFKHEWDRHHPSDPWEDDNNSLQHFIQILKNDGTWKKNKSKVPKSGNRNDWDPTALFFMLLYSGALNLPAVLKQHIDKLRQIRNEYFGHPSTASLSDAKFQAVYKDIEVCMDGLNYSARFKQEMDDIRTGVMKIPDDYMRNIEAEVKKVVAEMRTVVALQADNNKLLTKLHFLQKLILFFLVPLSALVCFSFVSSFMQSTMSSHESVRTNCVNMDIPVTRIGNSFGTYFPESMKPNYYVGHDREIDRAVSLLANGTYQIVTITGPPAIGKTATAITIGQELVKWHSFKVAFVDFEQLNVTSNQIEKDIFQEILFSLGTGFVPGTDVDPKQEFQTQMRTMKLNQTLLIFDGIETILDSKSKSKFFEVTKQCLSNNIKLIATSRKDFNIIGMSIHQIKLEPLSEPLSAEALHKMCPGLNEELVLEISKKTGGVPLLLELIGHLLQEAFYEEDELLTKLQQLPVLEIVNDITDLTESSNYFKMLKTFFADLDQDLQNTFIALGTIPMTFDQVTANVVVKFSLGERVNLHQLVKYNLLKKFHSAAGETLYEMHPVFRQFSRLLAKEKTQWSYMQCNSSFAFFHYDRVAGQHLVPATEADCFKIREHKNGLKIIQFLEALRQIQINCPHTDILENHMLSLMSSSAPKEDQEDLQLALYELLTSITTVLKSQKYPLCIDFTDDQKQREELMGLASLALIAAQQNSKTNLTLSIDFYNFTLAIYKSVLRDDQQGMIADIYEKIGFMSLNLQKYTDSVHALNEALAIRLHAHYADHHEQMKYEYDPNIVSIALIIGFLYQEKLNQYQESIEPFRIANTFFTNVPICGIKNIIYAYRFAIPMFLLLLLFIIGKGKTLKKRLLLIVWSFFWIWLVSSPNSNVFRLCYLYYYTGCVYIV
ncbi:uncharacterized protein [Amphiura filiformis]|uniref:uncharacterized protein n=1 Tax=Amphiura filiformis TaxID=82378 RepID=UPI003B20F379